LDFDFFAANNQRDEKSISRVTFVISGGYQLVLVITALDKTTNSCVR